MSDLPSSDSLKESSQDYKITDEKDEEKVDIDLSKTKFTGLEHGSLEVVCKVFLQNLMSCKKTWKIKSIKFKGESNK